MRDASAKPPRRTEWQSFLYVLGYKDGPVKVGNATDVGFRLKTLSREQGVNLTLFHYCGVMGRYALDAERYAHWLLRDHHYRSEWFNCHIETACWAIDRAASVDHRGMDTVPPVAPRGGNDRHIEHVSFMAPIGTYKAMDEARHDDESRAAFLRAAVETELKRRERAAKKQDG